MLLAKRGSVHLQCLPIVRLRLGVPLLPVPQIAETIEHDCDVFVLFTAQPPVHRQRFEQQLFSFIVATQLDQQIAQSVIAHARSELSPSERRRYMASDARISLSASS